MVKLSGQRYVNTKPPLCLPCHGIPVPRKPVLYQQVVAYKNWSISNAFTRSLTRSPRQHSKIIMKSSTIGNQAIRWYPLELDNLAHEKNNTSSSKAKASWRAVQHLDERHLPKHALGTSFTYLNCRLGLRPSGMTVSWWAMIIMKWLKSAGQSLF